MSDSLNRAMELLAQQEDQFAESSGSGLTDPADGEYNVILRKFNVGYGTYGKYRTGKDGPEESDACVLITPVVEIFDHPEAAGQQFSLGWFSNKEGSPFRKSGQDLDRLKSLMVGLLGIRLSEWTTTSDMLKRCIALENVGQYKVKVVRKPNPNGGEYINKYLGNRLADAS